MSSPPALRVRDLEAGYGTAGSGFTLRVPDLSLGAGEVLAVLGPNGAGKSTLLRVMAGLLPPRHGRVERESGRDAALVFQRPLMLAGSVAHNAALPLWARGVGRDERRRRAQRALEALGIGHLAGRAAATLSGGEVRRLALARALVTQPGVLLLDEPFDDLDRAGRETLSSDLERAIRETGVAVALVSHDLRQALLLADRVAVLDGGALVQADAAPEVLRRPVNAEVARIVGMENLLPGRIEGRDDRGLVRVTIEGGPSLACAGPAPEQAEVWVGVRPESVRLEPAHGDTAARRNDGPERAVVTRLVSDGLVTTAWLDWEGVALRTHLVAGRGLGHSLKRGDPVRLAVLPEDVHLMPREPSAPATSRAGRAPVPPIRAHSRA